VQDGDVYKKERIAVGNREKERELKKKRGCAYAFPSEPIVHLWKSQIEGK
jgi:hypothetical protein